MSLYPVILSGGAGTRLWPLSRDAYPKQFLPLCNSRSPFQATLARLNGIPEIRPPVIVANHEHRFLIRDQLRDADVSTNVYNSIESHQLFLEPFGRNTAPAIAVVAHRLMQQDPAATLLVLPADHDIPDHALFCRSVIRAAAAAKDGRLIVFGIQPRWPETGYGYIERGSPLTAAGDIHHVARFVEKPEIEIARHFVASGKHYWNSGIFLFAAKDFVAELDRLEPELSAACKQVANTLVEDQSSYHIDAQAFSKCRAVSVDHAVFEHTRLAAVIPAAFAWSDIGSWNTLWDVSKKDTRGNVIQGDVHLQDVTNSYVRSTRRMIVGIGLKDIVIVETPDALLVAERGSTQNVAIAMEDLRQQERPECRIHREVHRPWGQYEEIDADQRFRVKRITVNPGAKLSLQLHHHRAEHWVVVSGTALVTRGEETMLLSENQSTYIPVGVPHRLENPGKIPLQLIEVQSGSYLAEDDIVRIEDVYQRA